MAAGLITTLAADAKAFVASLEEQVSSSVYDHRAASPGHRRSALYHP